MTQPTVHADRRWFEDFATGDTFAFGRWRMTRDDMLAYAERYDPEPFHLDEAAARERGWGGLIASGPQIASICRRLQKDGFPRAETVISPGWDSLQWFQPVYAEDVLSCRATVLAAKPLASRPGEGLVKLENDILREGEVVARFVTNWFIRQRAAT